MQQQQLDPRTALAGLACLVSLCAPAAALQEAPPPFATVPWTHDTGEVENGSAQTEVVCSFRVAVDGALWLRLYFDEVMLAGDVTEGTGSILRITSERDGAVQELDARHCAQWRNSSAYFNGDAVVVEVVAQPATGPNRLVMARVELGLDGGFETICGPTDDRLPSSDPRAARALPSGCTAWLIDDCNHCLLTAGHCGSVNLIEFNVPNSNSNGSINHPPPSDQYAVDPESVQATPSVSLGNDWKTFGVFPNSVTGLTPAEAQGAWYTLALPPSFAPGQVIRITGYGTDDTPASWNQIQQTHAGPRVSSSGTVLEYMTDTTGGNSGSPIIFEQNGTAIGIHTNGGCSSGGGSNSGTATSNAGLQAALDDPQGVCAAGVHLLAPLPDLIAPGMATTIELEIFGTIAPGSATLFVSYDGAPFLAVPIVPTGGSFYEATLPPPVCAAEPRFYFAVHDANCGTVTLPQDAPQQFFAAEVGTAAQVFADDMEASLGWTGGQPGDTATTGVWVRVDPIGTEAQPESDHTVSGTNCWVTGQGSVGGGQGDNDVDGGITTLLSPALDLSGLVDPMVDYWRWYANGTGGSPGTDVLVIELSNNGGASWHAVETVGPSGPETVGGWIQHQFRVADIVSPTASMRMRLVAGDLGTGSIVEAGLDDFRVRDVTCTAMFADCNGNGIVDSDDIASGRSQDDDDNGIPDECAGDCNGNGVPDSQDIANGTSSDCNANALPDECELDASSYCFCPAGSCGNPDADAGCANSTGSGALLDACGSDGVGADDLQLVVSGLPSNQTGIVFMGPAQIQIPFGDGLRCVGAGGVGVFRFPVHNAGAGGSFTEGPGIVAHSIASFPAAGEIQPGSTWRFQGWYRDPSGPCGGTFNFSNAVSVVFGP